MTSEEFVRLYTIESSEESSDEKITPIIEDGIVGFTLIRRYKEDSEGYEDNKRMFISLYLKNGNEVYGKVDMVDPADKNDPDKYAIVFGEKYARMVTNFYFGPEEKIIFDEKKVKIFSETKNQYFSINDFIKIMIGNHLSSKLVWKRIILEKISIILLRPIFWLSDRDYEPIYELDSTRREVILKNSTVKEIDPFFKYFYTAKNILFSLSLVSFVALIIINCLFCFRKISLSNPLIVLSFFLILFIGEKLTYFLNKKIEEFLKGETNFIYRLYNYQLTIDFKLNFNKKL